jgi:hypothetical protein
MKSASKRNEYQEYFLGGKGGWCVRLTPLPHLRPHSFEIWYVNLQETSVLVEGLLYPYRTQHYLVH